jgi:hypothetical protein
MRFTIYSSTTPAKPSYRTFTFPFSFGLALLLAGFTIKQRFLLQSFGNASAFPRSG